MTNHEGTHHPEADLTPSLVARLRDGDGAAGELLDQVYRNKLVKFCSGYLGSTEEAEDVVQEAFYRVLRSRTVPNDFRAWVYRICRNRCLDVLRSRGRKRDDRELPEDSLLEDDVTGGLTRLVRREQASHLRRAVTALPVQQREVLNLRYAEGLSRAEIAQVLDIPESVVKSRLYEGLQNLRRHASLVDES